MTTNRIFRVGVDVGGTFTDIACLDPESKLYTKRVPPTASDYRQAIRAGLQALLAYMGVDGVSIGELIHGATVASSAILEHKEAITGLITTEGFAASTSVRRLGGSIPPSCDAPTCSAPHGRGR
jgi:N-methylhydantoinase A